MEFTRSKSNNEIYNLNKNITRNSNSNSNSSNIIVNSNKNIINKKMTENGNNIISKNIISSEEIVNEKITKEGKKILDKNNFFKKLMNLMNSTEFTDFYDEYFKDWSDIETIIFYIKLYKTISYEYTHRFNEEISDEVMTYMLYNVMSNKETRKLALEKFRDLKENKNIDMNKNSDLRYLLDFSNYSIKRTTSKIAYLNNEEHINKLDELLLK